MASYKFTLFAMCLLAFANCWVSSKDDSPMTIKVPEECLGKDFCSEKPDNYEMILARVNKLIPKHMLMEVQEREGIPEVESILSPKKDWHNCPTESIVATPTFAKDPKNETKYNLLVQGEKFKQSFVAIRCPHKIISEISHNSTNWQCFPDLFSKDKSITGMRSTCEQRYSMRLLYIYDEENDQLIMERYPIPVHCSCKLTTHT